MIYNFDANALTASAHRESDTPGQLMGIENGTWISTAQEKAYEHVVDKMKTAKHSNFLKRGFQVHDRVHCEAF